MRTILLVPIVNNLKGGKGRHRLSTRHCNDAKDAGRFLLPTDVWQDT
jgi:hypothetical protein